MHSGPWGTIQRATTFFRKSFAPSLVLEDQEGGVRVRRHHHKLRGGNHVDDTCNVATQSSCSISVGRSDGVCRIGRLIENCSAGGADIFSTGEMARRADTIRRELA